MSSLEQLLPAFALFGFAGTLLTQSLWAVLGIAAVIVRLSARARKPNAD